jgi:hypothetical protein
VTQPLQQQQSNLTLCRREVPASKLAIHRLPEATQRVVGLLAKTQRFDPRGGEIYGELLRSPLHEPELLP